MIRSPLSPTPDDPYGREMIDLVGIDAATFAQRGGIGKEFMSRFEQDFFQRGFARILLRFYATNMPARSLYKKVGLQLGIDGGQVPTLEKNRPNS